MQKDPWLCAEGFYQDNLNLICSLSVVIFTYLGGLKSGFTGTHMPLHLLKREAL